MDFLNKFSIRYRLFLAFGCVILLLTAFAVFGIVQLNEVANRYDSATRTNTNRQQYISGLITSIMSLRFFHVTYGYQTYYGELQTFIDRMYQETDISGAIVRGYLTNYRISVQEDQMLTNEDRLLKLASANEIENILNYRYIPAVTELMASINHEDRGVFLEALTATMESGNELLDLAWSLKEQTFDFAIYKAELTEGYAGRIVRTMWIGTLVMVVLVCLFTLWLVKAIMLPIDKLKLALTEVTNGNFNYPVRMELEDEIGTLSQSIGDMIDSISDMNKAASIADYLDMMICVTDLEQRLVYVNKNYMEAFGVDQDYEGRLCYEISGDDGKICSYCTLPKLKPDEPYVNYDFGFVWKPCLGKWFEGRAILVKWPDGRWVQLHYLIDATEKKESLDLQKAYEAQLKASIQDARTASMAKSAFIANTSHEIRTPMNSILGYSELALDDSVSGTTREYLINIIRNTKWLLNIINDIMDISNIESGMLQIDSVPFDINNVLNHCQFVVAPNAIAKNIVLHFYAEPPVGKKLVGDPSKLIQICMKILSNAIKFTDYGAVKCAVSILESTDNECTLKFEIRDSGIGMSEEQLTRLSEPFAQADTSITRKYTGVGLGLAITKRLVEAMGGELSVESALGIGSKFFFVLTFPVVDEDDAKKSDREITSDKHRLVSKPQFEKKEVLVVEDNEMNQGVICENLRRVGLKPIVACNGQQAVEMVRIRIQNNEPLYSLIFMDIHMPEMDGLEAASIISGWNTGIPIVTMTANVLTIAEETYKKCGMEGYISKPFTAQDLWRILLTYFDDLSGKENQENNLTGAEGTRGETSASASYNSFDNEIYGGIGSGPFSSGPLSSGPLNRTGTNGLNEPKGPYDSTKYDTTKYGTTKSFGDAGIKPFDGPSIGTGPSGGIGPSDGAGLSDLSGEDSFNEDPFFNKMLLHFVKNNQNVYEEISTAIQSKDMILAHRLAHNLKSNAGHIKKSALQTAAKDLEQELKEDRSSEVLLQVLKAELDLVLEELAPLLEEKEKEKEREKGQPQVSLALDEIEDIVAVLEPMLTSGNAAYLEYLDRLKQIPGSEQLVEQMENFDSSAASATLAILKKEWLNDK